MVRQEKALAAADFLRRRAAGPTQGALRPLIPHHHRRNKNMGTRTTGASRGISNAPSTRATSSGRRSLHRGLRHSRGAPGSNRREMAIPSLQQPQHLVGRPAPTAFSGTTRRGHCKEGDSHPPRNQRLRPASEAAGVCSAWGWRRGWSRMPSWTFCRASRRHVDSLTLFWLAAQIAVLSWLGYVPHNLAPAAGVGRSPSRSASAGVFGEYGRRVQTRTGHVREVVLGLAGGRRR